MLVHEPGTKGRVCGEDFTWTDEHPQINEIHKMLYTYDELAGDALNRIDDISPAGPKDGNKCPMSQRDLYALLELHAQSDKAIGKLWSQVTTIPEWVDWEQIERGQKLVFRYHGQMQLGLLFNSLLGGMGAWRVVETLSRTGGFGARVTRRRLLETTQHFLEVIENLDSVKPGGKGFTSSVRVRLLHATVRRRIMQLAKQRSGYYDTEQWGVPINDLHQVGTIASYSAALVFLALPRQGVYCTEQQIADYLALWRWIGYIMGTPVDWMATPSKAKAMMEVVMTAEIDPSLNSQIIANNILTAQASVPPMYASRQFLAALAYRLNGDELATALAIDRPNAWYRGLTSLQIFVFAVLSSSYPWLPKFWQKRRDAKFINFSRKMITDLKSGGLGQSAKFELQYIPELGKMTEMGKFDLDIWQRAFAAIIGSYMMITSLISLYI